MKNEFKVEGSVVKMEVSRKSTGEKFWVQCDIDAMPMLMSHYWRMHDKRDSVTCNFRKDGKLIGPTLHSMLTGSKFIKFLNGDKTDFRLENLEYSDLRIYKKPEVGQRLKGNRHLAHSGGVTLWTTNRAGEEVGQILIDADDLERVSGYTWGINAKTGYVQTRTRGGKKGSKGLYLHRFIMNAETGDEVDHINRIKTDNRKANLRLCSSSENKHNIGERLDNPSGVNGVLKTNPGWTAKITVNYKQIMKMFRTMDEAIAQRKSWEEEYGITPEPLRPSNKTGIVGVSRQKPKWVAQIKIEDKYRRKTFPTFEQAVAQRKAWEKELNPSGLNHESV